ncbi:hypothetical protein GCM10027296_29640 [Chitinimonas naiadis]
MPNDVRSSLDTLIQNWQGTPATLRLILHPQLAEPASRHDLLRDLATEQCHQLWHLLAPRQASWLCRTLLLLQKTAERARLRGAIESELGQLLHDSALTLWASQPLGTPMEETGLLRTAVQHLAEYSNLPPAILLRRLHEGLSPRQQQRSRMAERLLMLAEEHSTDLPFVSMASPARRVQHHQNGLLVQLATWLSQAPASAQIECALRRNWVSGLLSSSPDALVNMLRELAGIHWQPALVACLTEQQLAQLMDLLAPQSAAGQSLRPAANLPAIERQLAWCRLMRQGLQRDSDGLLPRTQSASHALRLFLRHGAWPSSLSKSGAPSLATWLESLPDACLQRELILVGPLAARQIAHLTTAEFQQRVIRLLTGKDATIVLQLHARLPATLLQPNITGREHAARSRHAVALLLATLLVRGNRRPLEGLATQLGTALALRYAMDKQALLLRLNAGPSLSVVGNISASQIDQFPVRPFTGKSTIPVEAVMRRTGVHAPM